MHFDKPLRPAAIVVVIIWYLDL